MKACEVSVDPDVHPALLRRFSPVQFRPEVSVSKGQVNTLLEAARRAPSAGNSQPWKFIVGVRGDAVHTRMLQHLAPSTARWVPSASLLIANLAHVRVEGALDWEYSEFARYDLGQAVAHMTLQALHVGLDAHQFRAFDRDAITADFGVPPHWEATSMTAFGVTAHEPGEVPSPGTSRERVSLDDIVWARE